MRVLPLPTHAASQISIMMRAQWSIALLNFTLIPRLGKNGAAIATFVAYLAAAIYLYFASQGAYRIPCRPIDAIAWLGLLWLLIGFNAVEKTV
jgi:O-antigen/teichoic acid export membrane protein